MIKSKYPEIGKRLRELRIKNHLKQKDCLKPLGDITIQMLSNWENGYVFPTYTYLIKISNFYKISLDYLLLGKNVDIDMPQIDNYKDVIKFLYAIIKKGLFDIYENSIKPMNSFATLHMTSNNNILCEFYSDYKALKTASRVLSKENYNKALDELFEKYNKNIKDNEIVDNKDKLTKLGF